MSSWEVTRGEKQFQVSNMEQLQHLARNGQLHSGDLIRPPQSAGWLYVGELPELKACIANDEPFEFQVSTKPSSSRIWIAVGLFIASIYFGYQAFGFWQAIPSPSDLELLGENGLADDQALITSDSTKIWKTQKGTAKIGSLSKNSTVTLKKKTGDYFQVETPKGSGWISKNDLVPAYLFSNDKKVHTEFDTRFNPHRKIMVKGASWARPEYGSETSNLYFQLLNLAHLPIGNITVSVAIKREDDSVLHEALFHIKGSIKPQEQELVGTILPEKNSDQEPRFLTQSGLEREEKSNPEIIKRWVAQIDLPVKIPKGIGKLKTSIVITAAEAFEAQ